jgi:hypothetical protein
LKRLIEDVPILGKVGVNLLELSNEVYKIYEVCGESERQKGTFHLGLISEAFKGMNHSRYDYLILQFVVSEIIDAFHKGTNSTQGSITISKRNYTGNDLIKTWILLSNFGHCKNTISDEKALLLGVSANKRNKTRLINLINDGDLKVWAEDVIEKFDYVNFHHILSIIRIIKATKKRIVLRKKILDAYRLLLLDSNLTSFIANPQKTDHLKSVYSNVRNLCILALDSRNTSLPFTFDILSAVVNYDLMESRFLQRTVGDLLRPMISLLYDTVYLDPKSQAFQRSYELRALSINPKLDMITIEKAIMNGLVTDRTCNLTHFVRVSVKYEFLENKNMKDDIRALLLIKRGIDNIEVSVDYNPYRLVRVIDFYTSDYFQVVDLPRLLEGIYRLVERQWSGVFKGIVHNNSKILKVATNAVDKLTDDPAKRQEAISKLTDVVYRQSLELINSHNLPVFKDLLWSVLKYYLDSRYTIDISSFGRHFEPYAVRLANGMSNIDKIFEDASLKITDPDQLHEVNQLRKSATRKYQGNVIVCLERIVIYDYSRPPEKRIVTDIDGIILKFKENELVLEIHEAKKNRHAVRDAKKDLDKLTSLLSRSANGRRIVGIKNSGAKVVI